MPIPESIRKVPRPVNTIIEDNLRDGPNRYAVRSRAGTRYVKNGNPQPRNGKVIGHIIEGKYVPIQEKTAEKIERVRGLNEIAKRRGQTLAEMALAWILKDGAVTSVLIGASKPAQILDNIKALENTTFTAEELAQIDALSVM